MSIRVKNLSKEYRSNGVTTVAIDDLSFEINQSEFVTILGKSGSGKSTLLSLLAGLTPPTQGGVYLDGKNISELQEEQLAMMRREKLGIIFQDFKLLANLTAIQNIELPLLAGGHPTTSRREALIPILKKLDIYDLASNYPNELSGGQRQRLGIARALANKPDIVIADEPTGNLDYQTGKSVVKLLQEISTETGTTSIMVTHDIRMVDDGMRVMILSDGRLQDDFMYNGSVDLNQVI